MMISEALNRIIDKFKIASIESPDLDAEVLLAHVLKIEKYRLIIDSNKEISPGDLKRFINLAKRRLKNEPVAYLTGKKEFYSLDFTVTKDVLIPRPETEHIVEFVLTSAKKNCSVLDIGTGSGAIAITIKKNRPDLKVYACDISSKSLKIAKKNAEIISGKDSILFTKSDLFDKYMGKKFDIVISNPPYLDAGSKKFFQKEILFEPDHALFAQDKGKEVIKRIVIGAGEFLNIDGLLILEFGSEQKSYLQNLAEKDYIVDIYNDYADLPRMAVLQKR